MTFASPKNSRSRRIEGCKLIPLGEVLSRVERELSKDEEVIIYCAHGVRSMHALMAMARMGYTRLRSLEGGICAWEEFLKAS